MVKLKGRVLEAPPLEYADKQKAEPNKGVWDMGRGGYMFKKSVRLSHWAIVNMDDRTGQRNIKEFVYTLQEEAARAGFDIDNPRKGYSACPREVSRNTCFILQAILIEYFFRLVEFSMIWPPKSQKFNWSSLLHQVNQFN